MLGVGAECDNCGFKIVSAHNPLVAFDRPAMPEGWFTVAGPYGGPATSQQVDHYCSLQCVVTDTERKMRLS